MRRPLFACWLVFAATASSPGQVTSWRVDAESGLAGVLDFSDASYDLVQSDVVGQGAAAFHLANPDFQANWFVIDQTISVQPDTNLYFLSQLRAATPDQAAKVRLSFDDGASWPQTIYSQPGVDFSGEGAFSLREVSLSAYEQQQVRLQFLLDFSFGSAFTQTDSRVGWFVDDIQIGSQFEKLPYSIGDPSPQAQQYLEFINRARADALVEAERLKSETSPSIQNAYSFFDIDPNQIVEQYEWYVDQGCIDRTAQPLSFNERLLTAADLHTLDMFENQFQGHVSSAQPPSPLQPGDTLGDRLERVGYAGGAGENVFAYADSVADGHAGFVVDWGRDNKSELACYNPAFDAQGMQNPAGHRLSIHNGDFKEVGVGVIDGTNGGVGPQVVTQDFGDPGAATFVTGVVYEDLNGNAFYDLGEGREGVRVDVAGSPYFAVSTASGAYSVPVSGDGQHQVTFAGGGFAAFEALATVRDGRNVKVDYLVELARQLACDFSGDGNCDAVDLARPAGLYGVGNLTAGVAATGDDKRFDLTGDGRIDLVDLDEWLALAAAQAGYAAAYLPGDADLDGAVEFADFLALAAAFATGSQWHEGDFNADGQTGFEDFLQLAKNFNITLPPAAAVVPEPAAAGHYWLPLLLGVLAWLRTDRKKKSPKSPDFGSTRKSKFWRIRPRQ